MEMKETKMNKKVFQENLNSKNYDKCIEILRREIIMHLEQEIKRKDENFHYTTTEDLYYKSKKVLKGDKVEVAYKLYSFDIMDESDEYILFELMDIYNEAKQ